MFAWARKYCIIGVLLWQLLIGCSSGDASNVTTAGDNATTVAQTTLAVSTIAANTTQLPVTTTTSGPSTPTFYVRREDGSSCIVFQTSVKLEFQYPLNATGEIADMEFDGIPLVYGSTAVPAVGSCDGGEQSIVIPLANNWTLSAGFASKDQYSFISSLNVSFLLDGRVFQGYTNRSIYVTATKQFSPFDLFNTPVGSSFQCNAGVDVTGFTSANLIRVTFSSFRVQSFAKLNTTQFAGPARRCDGDVSQVVPIVVAVVLGVLIVAVVVLYFVFHIRAKKYSEIK